MLKQPVIHRIALLFNANKVYDREIIAGIGEYLSSTRVAWDLFLEEDFRCRPETISQWQGDGFIADFDDPDVAAALCGDARPVIATGGSYAKESDYPDDVSYVATDNRALIELAYRHLIESGLTQFALYSIPPNPGNRWALERERAFEALTQREGLIPHVHRGLPTSASGWSEAQRDIAAWLKVLPRPIGIIAVTDARARQVLQACLQEGIAVPEEVAIIGIDNDPLTQAITRIPLSSVIQGTREMGRTAASLLHRRLSTGHLPVQRHLVAPQGINAQASSKHVMLSSPLVMRARHFIRQYAAQGIKTGQVADYVGVSRTTLETSFKRELKHSVHDEILHFKLEIACNHLAEGKLSISDIAVKCGFTSLQYMYAVFKREIGCTPREYQINLHAASQR
ncbi:DNA-binding transcriptional regulator [Viridibacterium curvum]|uniref:XylR family transcriptional regulator n=1 Tax=Viridibacterium curvum TaxID=1101404 RepID=A0ABP9R735_9RHOO